MVNISGDFFQKYKRQFKDYKDFSASLFGVPFQKRSEEASQKKVLLPSKRAFEFKGTTTHTSFSGGSAQKERN